MTNEQLMEVLTIADTIEERGWHIAAVRLRQIVGEYKSLLADRDGLLVRISNATSRRAEMKYTDSYVRTFIGFLSAVVPELKNVEVPHLADEWERFKKQVPVDSVPSTSAGVKSG